VRADTARAGPASLLRKVAQMMRCGCAPLVRTGRLTLAAESQYPGATMPTTTPNWTSPARWLVPRVPRSPSRAAPERAAALDEMIAAVRLSFPDLGSFVCEYRPDTRIVVVSRKVLEVAWASSYAYFVVYRRVFEELPQDEHAVIDLHADPVLGPAADLLFWVHNDWLLGKDTPWPANLPQPTSSAADSSNERYATGVFDIAIAFILHHELAHHRLGHSGSEHETEHDADYEAARWLLEGLHDTSSAFQYRAYGIATALVILSARAIHRESFSSPTIPVRSIDFLIHWTGSLWMATIPRGEWPWSFCAFILRLRASKFPLRRIVMRESASMPMSRHLQGGARPEFPNVAAPMSDGARKCRHEERSGARAAPFRNSPQHSDAHAVARSRMHAITGPSGRDRP
jgi:hypothetical protein